MYCIGKGQVRERGAGWGEGAVGVDKKQIDRGQVRDRLPVRDKGG